MYWTIWGVETDILGWKALILLHFEKRQQNQGAQKAIGQALILAGSFLHSYHH